MFRNTMVQNTLTQHQLQAVQIVDRYWHALAVKDGLPQRSEIDPGAIQDALEYAFIGEQLSGGHTRLRVAGGSISAVMGMEIAGMPLAVLVRPSARDAFARHVARVFETPTKMTLTLHAAAKYGQPELEAKVHLYPLRDGSKINKLIGTFVTSGVIGRTPRRFDVSSVEEIPALNPNPSVASPIITRGHLSLVVSN